MVERIRFPRLEGITPRVRMYERLLHQTYNQLFLRRNPGARARAWRWDIFKTRNGRRAPFFFTVLALQLVEKSIDPSLYLKTMAVYGKFEYSRYLPPVSWLADEETVKKFYWLHQRERNKYEREEDWKRSKHGYREKDIFRAIESSAEFLQQGCDNLKMGELATITVLLSELSPWMIAVYLGIANKKVSETLMQLVLNNPIVRSQVGLCMYHLKKNEYTYHRAKKILRECISHDEPAQPRRFPRE
jgi:hypothetical protein